MSLLNIALATILAALQLFPAAQLLPAEVRPEQDSYTIAAGTEMTIVVRLENATGVYGIDVRASFDPVLLELLDADNTADGVQVEAGSFPQPDFVAANRVDPVAGTIRYVITQMNPMPPANGSGVLFTVRLRGRGPSGTAEFRIDQVEMSDRDGQLLPVNVSGATVEVAGSDLTGADAAPTGVAIAPTTGAATQSTPTVVPAEAATATATTSVAQPAATQGPSTSQPAAATVTPASPTEEPAGSSAPVAQGPSPTTAADVAPPTVAPVVVDDAAPATSSGSAEVALPGEGQTAAEDEPNTSPAESGRSDAVADAAVVEPPAPDLTIIGEGQAVDTAAAGVEEANDQGGNALWPIGLAIGFVALLAGALVIFNRRST